MTSTTARELVGARHLGHQLTAFPGSVPTQLDEAYAVQDGVLALDPGSVVGWKLGTISSSFRQQFAATRFIGPIMSGTVARANGDQPVSLPCREGWLTGIEAEFTFEIGEDLPARQKQYEPADVASFTDKVYASVEVIGSPIAGIIGLGPGAIVSDYGVNAGLVLGAPIPDWASRPPEALSVRVTVDTGPAIDGNAACISDGLSGAVAFVINEITRRGRHIRRGDLICTGATTGLHQVANSSDITIEFDGSGTVVLSIVGVLGTASGSIEEGSGSLG